MTDGRKDSVNSGDAARDPRLDRLYREAVREEPPAHLDAAILAAAHREAGARPRPLSARLRTWRVPVSIAAVVMLSVSLVTLVREERGDQLMQPAQRDLQSTLKRPATAEQSSRPQTAPEPEAKKSPAAEQAPAATPREDRALGATASETGRRQSGAPARKRAAESQDSPPVAARPEPQPFASAAPERAGPPAAPDTTTSADAATRSASRPGAREELAAPAPRPAPTPGAEALMRDAAPMGEAAGAASGAPKPPAAAAPATKPRQRVEARAAMKERPAADTAYLAGLMKELDAQPPGKWLEKIQELRREGRPAEADEMLAEFKRRYPAYELPERLR